MYCAPASVTKDAPDSSPPEEPRHWNQRRNEFYASNNTSIAAVFLSLFLAQPGLRLGITAGAAANFSLLFLSTFLSLK